MADSIYEVARRIVEKLEERDAQLVTIVDGWQQEGDPGLPLVGAFRADTLARVIRAGLPVDERGPSNLRRSS